ncbi:MAG: hypothetical protein KDE35_15695 [Geminicoccaceae bacterium]|nr:hypothetical protein [Geminicoccaceae bacterium]
MNHDQPPNERVTGAHWLEDRRNVDRLVIALAVACALLFFADALYAKHPYFDIENLFGFYAIFGFVVSAGFVFGALWLRALVMRPRDYYDRDG